MGVLEGKVAIVTGAGRGIGRAIAERFALEGAKVVVASRTKSTVEAVVAEISEAGGSALGLTVDVGDGEKIREMVASAIESFGTVDILVNNAQSFGTRAQPESSPPQTPLEDLTEAELAWTFDTGMRATLLAMQSVFPYMRANGGGRIINFGSRRGITGDPETVAYNCTKEAIRALSRTAANSWGKYGINVNVINPVAETEAAHSVFAQVPGIRERTERAIPLRRWGTPYDCARVAVFLAGPDSGYLTGLTVMADGGLTSLP